MDEVHRQSIGNGTELSLPPLNVPLFENLDMFTNPEAF
jgi:hypothetical protein